MADFLQDSTFYVQPLVDKVGVQAPFKSVRACMEGYEKLKPYVRKRSVALEVKDELTSCFGLAMTKFLIEEKGFEWKLERYHFGQVYYQPWMIIEGKFRSDPISITASCLVERQGKIPFDTYYWLLTGVPCSEFESLL
ncbi:hypothetical protein [Hymenobacter crusticola]|nr:hypothetical protein [Hymenobacter crusticola]